MKPSWIKKLDILVSSRDDLRVILLEINQISNIFKRKS
tara:strand:- start:227 stop:340 length:114 start_codon:yes stop_codon:yes gene_type:complete